MPRPGPILVVDDEPDLRDLLALTLRREGLDVAVAATGEEALGLVVGLRPALVVLDLMLPDVPGTEVCRRIRANPQVATTPIVMLTARGEEIDRVVGFEIGADDYVVKSTFSMREFVLRVRAVLRRTEQEPTEARLPTSSPARFGPIEIDVDGHRVFVRREEIPMTATEFRLLATLAQRPGHVFSRGTLLEQVWELPADIDTRTVDTHVKRLREKLGEASVAIETVRGVGYRFDPASLVRDELNTRWEE